MPIINQQTIAALKGEDDLNWEQCVRLLLVNSITTLGSLQHYVNKIIANIISNPTEEKFLKLKFQNTVLQKNIFSVNGGLELLLSIGFQFELDPVNSEKYLVYPLLPMISLQKNENYQRSLTPEAKENDELQFSEYLSRLQTCENWLNNTIATCTQFYQVKQASSSTSSSSPKPSGPEHQIPADSLIQLQLPTGKTVIGGFMKGDLFFDVWKFACSYFTADRHDLVELRLPYESAAVSHDDFHKTILELSFFPRTKFIVFAMDAHQLENMKLSKVIIMFLLIVSKTVCDNPFPFNSLTLQRFKEKKSMFENNTKLPSMKSQFVHAFL
jgi:hypothetical protein